MSLFIMSLVVFALSRMTGNLALVLLPETATPAERQAFTIEEGLNRPLVVQYFIWTGNALHGNLGNSVEGGIPVTTELADAIPNSAELALAGFVVSLLIGIPGGIYAAFRHGTGFDHFSRLFATIGLAVPSFWLGIMLIMVFAVRFHVLPAGGKQGPASIVLPALTLGLVTGAGVLRITRSSMLEVLDKDYIKIARIKGVSETAVLWSHALKNAAPVVMTYGGLVLFTLLTGTIVVEEVFAWPGVGTLLFNSVSLRDFPTVQAGVLLVTLVYLIGNFLVDVGYAVLNPRVHFS